MSGASQNPIFLLLIGPLIALLIASDLASTLILLTLSGRLSFGRQIFRQARSYYQKSGTYSFFAGTALLLLLIVLAFKVFFTHRALSILGLVVVALGFTLISTGCIVAGDHLGERMTAYDHRSVSGKYNARLGFGLLTAASILPVAGWLIAGSMVLAGAGAVLRALLSNQAPAEPFEIADKGFES